MASPSFVSEWTPRVPLVGAERFVDYLAHNDHIVQRRLAVERHAKPAARRLALAVAQFGFPTQTIQRDLEDAIYVSLVRSVDFGYRHAKREIRDMRAGRTPQAAARIPGVGGDARVALGGLDRIHALVRRRAQTVANDVAEAANTAKHKAETQIGTDQSTTTVAVADAVNRTLHNDVLQLVGESLNLGRTAGALDSHPVPEFALRSEQLDERTCEACDTLHGEIAQVDSPEFYALSPPEGCFGGGRCRGLWVFEDGPDLAFPDLGF